MRILCDAYHAEFESHQCSILDISAKEAKFIWSPQHETAFQEVRELVVWHPVLKYYDLLEEVTVQCDASECGLGATLLKKMANQSPLLHVPYHRLRGNTRGLVSALLAVKKDLSNLITNHYSLFFRGQSALLPVGYKGWCWHYSALTLTLRTSQVHKCMFPTRLSRASLDDNKEMTDKFQVSALEEETLIPFDSI